MTPVKLTLISGAELTIEADGGDLVTALAQQVPAHLIPGENGQRRVLNMRNVVALEYTVEVPAEPAAEEPAPEEPAPDAPAPEAPAEPQAASENPQEPAPAEEPAPKREVKMIPDPDQNADPDRTVAQLKEALDAKGIEYDSKALKADLQKLANDNDV